MNTFGMVSMVALLAAGVVFAEGIGGAGMGPEAEGGIQVKANGHYTTKVVKRDPAELQAMRDFMVKQQQLQNQTQTGLSSEAWDNWLSNTNTSQQRDQDVQNLINYVKKTDPDATMLGEVEIQNSEISRNAYDLYKAKDKEISRNPYDVDKANTDKEIARNPYDVDKANTDKEIARNPYEVDKANTDKEIARNPYDVDKAKAEEEKKKYSEDTEKLANDCSKADKQAEAKKLAGDSAARKGYLESQKFKANDSCLAASKAAMEACAKGDVEGVKKEWEKVGQECKSPIVVNNPNPQSQAMTNARGDTPIGRVESPLDGIKQALSGLTQLNANGQANPMQQMMMAMLMQKVQDMMGGGSGGGSGSNNNGLSTTCVRDPNWYTGNGLSNQNGTYGPDGTYCPPGTVAIATQNNDRDDEYYEDDTKIDENDIADAKKLLKSCDKVSGKEAKTSTAYLDAKTDKKVETKGMTEAELAKLVKVVTKKTTETCENGNSKVSKHVTETRPDGKEEVIESEAIELSDKNQAMLDALEKDKKDKK